jgi:hypothetical protein
VLTEPSDHTPIVDADPANDNPSVAGERAA